LSRRWWGGNISGADDWIIKLVEEGYLSKVPKDPLNKPARGVTCAACPWSGGYCYAYGCRWKDMDDTYLYDQFYTLIALLENPNDPDRCQLKHWQSCECGDFCPDPDPNKPPKNDYKWKKQFFVLRGGPPCPSHSE